MKGHTFFSAILAAMALFGACGTTNSEMIRQGNEDLVFNQPLNLSQDATLADVLRLHTNLKVIGRGKDVTVQVRGASSPDRSADVGLLQAHMPGYWIMENSDLSTGPLYVLDDVALGNHYINANTLIRLNDIYRVKVLIHEEQTTAWGHAGQFGVILIETRSQKEE